ncbi:AP endonuclease [Acrasis kona]|uniref:DNA repair nuclease/redox regulator APEX1 n=1 Tax=Acrasis kona TaxID=1008807 RepID=A0AAW2YZJ9_9EUKA
MVGKRKAEAEGSGDKKVKVDREHPYDEDSEYKLVSWNVNGYKAFWGKESGKYLKDLVAKVGKFRTALEGTYEDILPGYVSHFNSCTAKNGYSGTAVYIKNSIKPIAVTFGMGIEKHDTEGRNITVELPEYYFVVSYVPNSGSKLERLDYRTEEWDVDMFKYLNTLQEKKPVIWTGDLNVAILDIDVHNPKGNKNTAGFTDQERNSFRKLIDEHKYIDSFRHFQKDVKNCYTYWGYRMNMREKDKGWRLDYFMTSESLKDKLKDSYILKSYLGSDHCPLGLIIKK